MKKLVVFLSFFVLISLAFAAGAFAVSTKNEANVIGLVSGVDGVSRVCEDFEGESFSVQKKLTQELKGLAVSYGETPSALNISSLKFGHFRSMRSTDEKNTFADWRFHEASEAVNADSDAYIALGAKNYDLTDLSYQVLEFDMSTMTSFPSNLWLFSEWRDSDSGGKRRLKFGMYNAEDGLWHFGDKTLRIEKNEWVHITIAIAIRCSNDGTNVDYTASVGRIFVNGELMNEIYPYKGAVLSSSLTLRQHYLGLGWPYGDAGARPGMEDNSSVAIDNVCLTKCQKQSYSGNLEKVFETSFDNLSSYSGNEIVYNSSYSSPSSAMASATVEVGNQTVAFDSLQDAADYVKQQGAENARVRLWADAYHALRADARMMLDLNGCRLLGGVSTNGAAYPYEEVEADVWSYELYAIFEAFQAPYEERVAPVSSQAVAIGESYTLPEAELFVDPKTRDRYEPTGEWLLYDEDGKVIEGGIRTITKDHAGGHYVLCPVYTSPSVYFTVIDSSGKMTHYKDPAHLVGKNIPEGATVVLKRDIPYTSTIKAKNFSIDLNGYDIYCVDGAKPTLICGSGTIFLYSSRPGARIFSGSNMRNGNYDEEGNAIYTNQAAYFVADDDASAGAKFMMGYKDEQTPSPYRIEAHTAAFIQLGKASDISLYLCNFDVICSAQDNKGILTTRNNYKNRYWQIDSCNFIIANNKALCSNVNTDVNVGVYVFNNSNIYGNGGVLGYEGSVYSDVSVTFNSTSVYGEHAVNPGSFTVKKTENGVEVEKSFNAYLYITGNCYLSNVSESGCILPEGYMILSTSKVDTIPLFASPLYARYENLKSGNTQYLGGSYTATGYLGKIEDFAKLVRQSVAIDSSISVLFFVPKIATLRGVYLDGENILDENDFRVIDGQKCYVIRVTTAPKDAYTSREIVLSFRAAETTLTLDASLGYYAQKLFAVSEVGNFASYYADSKALMRYVLYYARTAAKSLGGVSDELLSEFDGYLDGFAIGESDKSIAETVYTTTSASGALDAATLDLESKVGMVFRVKEGFVGTIGVSMPGVKSEVRTYTKDAPAQKNEYIILKNIPAHLLRSNVTVSIRPESGFATTVYFNLATYVNAMKTDIAYAVYAYAKQASVYRTKYPNAFAAED